METKGGSLNKLFIIMSIFMVISLGIAFLWDSLPPIKNAVHYVFDPSFGALINWNATWGMLLVVFIISLLTSLIQKYTTDQTTLRELKKEQKAIQKEMNQYKQDPQKMMEIQKNLWPTTMKIMELSMRGSMYTIIPFILLFRWFMDFFETIGNPHFFGFISWFWFYLIFVMIFSSVLRKALKVA
jgi:uncharacterized membrane protein (DUF106 family)